MIRSTAFSARSASASSLAMVFLLRAPSGRPAGLPLCPGWNCMGSSARLFLYVLSFCIFVVCHVTSLAQMGHRSSVLSVSNVTLLRLYVNTQITLVVHGFVNGSLITGQLGGPP